MTAYKKGIKSRTT